MAVETEGAYIIETVAAGEDRNALATTAVDYGCRILRFNRDDALAVARVLRGVYPGLKWQAVLAPASDPGDLSGSTEA